MAGAAKRVARLGCAALVTWVCAEVAACGAGRVLAARGILYEDTGTAGFGEYLINHDPVLGWPGRAALGGGELDAIRSRIVPASPDPTAEPCASIYGDSFAWSSEVDAVHAWGNVLSQLAGCRVHNFGVAAYGTDQAYLRFRKLEGVDRSKVVILTHLSENVLRNVNRFRNLIAPANTFAFKPRFVIAEGGEIALLPMPAPAAEEDARALLRSPERYLDEEWFAPGGPAGVVKDAFPYTLAVARSLGSYRVRAALAGEPPHAAFYRADHPSRGLAVSAGILRAFRHDAVARGVSPYVVFIPLPADFEYRKGHGSFPYASLVEEARRAGIQYLDIGDHLVERLQGRSPCSLYRRCAGGHFNEDGYRALGEIAFEFLSAHGALPEIRRVEARGAGL